MATHYPIVFEREDSGVFSAYVAGLPVYAQGPTRSKVASAIVRTLRAYLDAHPQERAARGGTGRQSGDSYTRRLAPEGEFGDRCGAGGAPHERTQGGELACEWPAGRTPAQAYRPLIPDAGRGMEDLSPTSVHERPNTAKTREHQRPESKTNQQKRTLRNLQNLHPRFKSGRRLQIYLRFPTLSLLAQPVPRRHLPHTCPIARARPLSWSTRHPRVFLLCDATEDPHGACWVPRVVRLCDYLATRVPTVLAGP